ncbi:phosphopantetheinyl transferase component of siderophore synthetase [Puniceibacterium sp. IMCC21224]|nr:phosphopantetheinyl transferase component of siderophore synthetase [Puniceibacterium sp. IMCC21224]
MNAGPLSTDDTVAALPTWLDDAGLSARWMTLDGSDMATLGISLPPVLGRAVAKRQGEYRAGRTCARYAIRQLRPTPPVFDSSTVDWPLLGPDRAPIWPSGVIGSLTHNSGFVICVVGASQQFSGLGIDVEAPVAPDDSLGLGPRIVHPDELALLVNTPWSEAGFTLLFSAKEALFKAVYPTVRRFVDFHEARLTALTDDILHFELMPDLASQLGHQRTLYVRAAWWRGQVLTFCARSAQIVPNDFRPR